MTLSPKTKPVHQVRFGNVKVAVWANQSQDGRIFHSFDLRRSYRDQNGDWIEQKISLNLNEIAKVKGALGKVYADYYTLPQFKRDSDTSSGREELPEEPVEIEGQY